MTPSLICGPLLGVFSASNSICEKFMAQNSNAFVQTFEKGLQILEFLVEESSVSVTSVARRMGIQKSASYRFLNTLRLHGYVEKDPNNSYRLTDRLSKLGKGIVPKREFHNVVSYFLDNLAKKNKENNGVCNLGMWNGREIVYMVQSANDKYMLFTVGRTVPAYCTALGKAVLAHLSEEALESYIQRTDFVSYTENTLNCPERLRAELQSVRDKGYALMDDELYPGLKGLAMPVLCADAPVRYAVSVTQTIYGPPDLLVDQMLKPLQETVLDIMASMQIYNFGQ